MGLVEDDCHGGVVLADNRGRWAGYGPPDYTGEREVFRGLNFRIRRKRVELSDL